MKNIVVTCIPALLRYNWNTPLCEFKVYSVLISHIYILQNNYHCSVNTYIKSHNISFWLWEYLISTYSATFSYVLQYY